MNNITAVSFLYKGERLLVKATKQGKFRVPVSEVVSGNLRTRHKSLSARQVVEHEVIKICDPTLYLEDGRRVRVFQGGDPSYLPAEQDGIITKHDEHYANSFSKSFLGDKRSFDSSNSFAHDYDGMPFFWDDGYAD